MGSRSRAGPFEDQTFLQASFLRVGKDSGSGEESGRKIMRQVFRILALVMCLVAGWAGAVIAQEENRSPVLDQLRGIPTERSGPGPQQPKRTEEEIRQENLQAKIGSCIQMRAKPSENQICRGDLEREGYRAIRDAVIWNFHHDYFKWVLMKRENAYAICHGFLNEEIAFTVCIKLSEPPK